MENVNKVLTNPPNQSFRQAAKNLEKAFLSEMLKLALPKESDGAFSGGVGEAQFHSFLVEEQAKLISGKIDLGIARAMEGRHGL